MFTIATVSNQIQSNHIAWSFPIATVDTLQQAQRIAEVQHQKIISEFEMREDIVAGAVVDESVIIHDGENIY